MKNFHVPLFDANSHPTVGGGWSSKGLDSSFAALSTGLRQNGYRGACAVGVWGMEDYSHEAFHKLCRRYENLLPIAGYFPRTASGAARELAALKKMGYRGAKIHPREPRINLRDPRLVRTFQAAAKLEFPLFLCTYHHSKFPGYPIEDPFFDTARLLQKAPGARVVLMHGGDVNLLRYAELARFNPNLLLDLSMTILKYRGSSLDLDMRFLLERFDRRICVGTDFPEYTHLEVRDRFAELSKGIARDKAENAGFRNIERFLGI